MKEDVEVVIKIGFDSKETHMHIMTDAYKNVKYCTTNCNGDVPVYCLSIKNAKMFYKKYSVEHGGEYYSFNRDEDLWVYESPKPIEYYITRTENSNE